MSFGLLKKRFGVCFKSPNAYSGAYPFTFWQHIKA